MSHPRRAFISLGNEDPIGKQFELSDVDSDHFRKVLRLKVDDKITVVDQQTATAYIATITQSGKSTSVLIEKPTSEKLYTSPVNTLVCALLKGDKNELVIEKATEMGVKSILFFHAERSVLKINDEQKAKKKLARWDKIAESAAKQSAKLFCPSLGLSQSLSEALQLLKALPVYYASLEPKAESLKTISASISFPLAAVIGPEGDFSDAELALLEHSAARPFSLGPFVLRSETAAISAISSLTTLEQLSS